MSARALRCLAAASALSASVAVAGGEPLLELEPGRSVNVCEQRLMACPARPPMLCDDPKVARWTSGATGLELWAVAPGETLCSATSATELRAIFRVVVKAPGATGASRPSR